jgi:hypothetical protein
MQRHIFIALPDNGMGLARIKWAESLFMATVSGVFSGCAITCQRFSSPYPGEVCNEIAHAFLKSEATELMLQDLDVVYTPRDAARLLSHRVPYVGGILPKRVLGLELAVWTDQEFAENPESEGVNPLVPAVFGRGFCLIHREVFETVAPHVPEYLDEPSGTMRRAFFQYKPGGIGSEDFFFCEKYKELGGNPVVDQRIVLGHVGDITYPVPGTF